MKVLILSLGLLSILAVVPKSFATEFDIFDYDPKLLENSLALDSKDTDPYPAYFHLLYFIQYVLLGKPEPGKPSIFDIIDGAPDSINLAEMIGFGSQNFYLYWTENGYAEEGFEEVWADWVKIVLVLVNEGADKVTLGMLKPFIDFLRPSNIFYVLQKLNKGANNLDKYIKEEFLSRIKDPYCRNYVGLWFQDIQQGKLWALKMFDNIGKPPTGLFNGGINWLGAYKACRKIEVSVDEKNGFHGKYCRTTLGFPLDLVGDIGIPITDSIGLNVGICVPHQCPEEDVAAITLKTLQLLAAHKFLSVKKVICDEDIPYSSEFVGVTVFLSIIALICVLATVFDGVRRSLQAEPEELPSIQDTIDSKTKITGSNVVDKKQQAAHKKKKNPIVEFLLNCSLYANSERIFRTDNGGKFTCLNGLRALSMVWIIAAHSFKYLSDYDQVFLVANLVELKEIEEAPVAQLIIGGMYGVDTFFLMSAFLLTYSMMGKLEKHNRLTTFEWIYYYVHRYWRLLPPYMIALAIQAFIMPFVGNGPIWNQKNYPSNRDQCVDYWWAYLLMVNNFVPDGKGTACMGFLWYVSNDYQLYAVSPIFLILLFKYPLAGLVCLIFTLASSVGILAFLTENIYASKGRDILTTLQSVWEDVYIKPYCRAGPWIIGIFLGYIFFKYRKVTINKFLVFCGWIASAVLALTTIFANYTNHEKGGRRMEVMEYGAYFSLTRVIFPLSIGWVIFACHYGYGGVINKFLSAKAFIPITRISYCAYLVHPLIIQAYLYSQEALFHGSGLTLVYFLLGNIIFTFFVAFLYTMIFEQPFIALEKLVMSKRNQKSDD